MFVSSKLHAGSVFDVAVAAPLAPCVRWLAEALLAPVAIAATRTVATLHGHVLLAEDGPDNRRLIVALLEHLGLTVDVVEDGSQAVRADLAGDFDLVLMDIQMPVMDGLEAARALHAAGYTRPLVALTANVMQDDVACYTQAGFARWIGKPIDVAALTDALGVLLEQSAGRAARETMADIPGFAEICASWRASLDGRLAELQYLLAYGALRQVTTLSHALRGTGSTFGYVGVTRLAGEIEMAAAKGDGIAASAAMARLLALDELRQEAPR